MFKLIIINYFIVILIIHSSGFSQDTPGILETGDFSVHKYFYEIYKEYSDEYMPFDASAYPPDFEQHHINKENLRYKVFGYFPYWFLSRWNTLSYNLLHLIVFHSAEIDSMGNITNDHGWSNSSNVANFINAAKQNNVKVLLSATLFSGNSITTLLNNFSYRTNLIKNLIQLVKLRNINGIDINFEGIQSGQRDSLTSFLKQLKDSLIANDSSYLLTCAPTDFDFRRGNWDLARVTQICDLTFLQCYGYAYSTGSQAGPVGRLQGWSSLNASNFINNALASGAIPSKTIYGMPHYGYDWPVNSPNKKASTLGAGTVLYYPDAKINAIEYSRLWDEESLNPWYRYQTSDGIWHQGWYEDPESAYYKYQFIKSKNLAGVGIWALGMDNTNKDIWNVLEEFVKDTTISYPPEPPIILFVKGKNVENYGEINIKWNHLIPNSIIGYRIYLCMDSINFSPQPYLNENYLTRDSTTLKLKYLLKDRIYYFKITSVNSNGIESISSDIYSASTGARKRYLVVDGFDRTTGSYSTPYHSFNECYASGIFLAGRDCDAASNEAVISYQVNLNDYSGVLWFLGDESTANKTFSGSEQFIIKNYLRDGGNLFVTGSEIAYELNSSAQEFLNQYLKAKYILDNSGSLFVYSNINIIRQLPQDLNLGIIYPEDWPDAIDTINGSQSCLSYRNQRTGGIYYNGLFPNGQQSGKLVYLSFALETVGNKNSKNIVIEDVLRFFESQTEVVQESNTTENFTVTQNFPNPFNSTTKIAVYSPQVGKIKLKLFNTIGQEIFEKDMYIKAGKNNIELNLSYLTTGIYFLNIKFDNQIRTIKLNLIK